MFQDFHHCNENYNFEAKNEQDEKTLISVILDFTLLGVVEAQVYTNKPVGEKQAALVDSLKTTPYPYALPIWGDKATALGFDLPINDVFSGFGTFRRKVINARTIAEVD